MTIMSSKKVIVQEDSDNEKSDVDSTTQSFSDEAESSGSEAHSDDETNDNKHNAGWADSIAKILKTNKPKKKKTLVLSKAKKLTDVRKTKSKPVGFEVQTAEGDIKEEKIEDNNTEPPDTSTRKRKREIPTIRKKPNILEKDRERTLTKIATRGVVQLFNAVKDQQKDISTKLKEAGPLEVKKDKVLKNIDKRTFLDVLMGQKSQNVEPSENSSSVVASKDQTWGILREDFMMGAKLKDWDKELEKESENEIEIE